MSSVTFVSNLDISNRMATWSTARAYQNPRGKKNQMMLIIEMTCDDKFSLSSTEEENTLFP